ncbi:Very short patch repair protein [Stratiformator vulcanicus]|uniref:Very short patch repair protein n=2 Tax=Stratiformator vulcanicus TaxID=2527980 RepID=A0A517R6B0_9PLAN|nr:Very short patch repair protein [Stratiformator vulcanicus]
MVFPGRRKVIFVHGCFWHRHDCPRGHATPATRPEFWAEKFARNIARDKRNIRELRKLGWSVMTIWECQTLSANLPTTIKRTIRFLG